MERQILTLLFTSRKLYEELLPLLSEQEFSPIGQVIFNAIVEYYEIDAAANACDIDILTQRLSRKHPKSADTFKQLLVSFTPNTTTTTTTTSFGNVRAELYAFKLNQLGQRLSVALLDHKDNCEELINEYIQLMALSKDDGTVVSSANVVTAVDVSAVVSNLTGDGLYKLYPNSLNAAVGGGVPEQTHIVVYAEPELGKSAFCINLAACAARDGNRVLFIDNEDPLKSTIMRFICRLTNLTQQEIVDNPQAAHELALQKGYGNITIASLCPGTVDEIDSLITEYEPAYLIVNQIRHLYFKGVDGEVAQLTKAGAAMRRLIKKHNIVGVSVHQAADSATNKSVLTRGDCYMSNTSLPGDADILLGIGATVDMRANGLRMISLAKNKINGNHAPFAVVFDEQRSKFTSLL